MAVNLGRRLSSYERRRVKQRRNEARWRETHPGYNRLAARKTRLKAFGLTEADFNRMYEAQKGVCKICGEDPGGHWLNPNVKTLHIDHCHKTNKVRGLLCLRCNSALGLFRDNPKLLEKAAAYLKENS